MHCIVTLIRLVQMKVLEYPVCQSNSGMCVIRDTDGTVSWDAGAAIRGKHNNQCLERAQARSK